MIPKPKVKDPLFKNSLFLMFSSAETALFGFIFWFLAAKIYTAEAVGIAAAIISSVGLLNLISRLGFDESMIRFLPEMDRGRVFWTSAIFTATFATLFGIFFYMFIDFFPSLSILKEVFPLYIFLLISSSFLSTNSSFFISMRKAEISFVQTTFLGTRILFLIPFSFLGTVGILFSLASALLFALTFSSILILKFKIKFKFDEKFLKRSLSFSAGNYTANSLTSLPSMLMPIIVLNVLGAEENAIYYISYAIGAFLFIIPSSFGTSLFVEGSYGERMKEKAIKSIFGTYLLLFPAVFLTVFLGEYLLAFLGKNYEKGLFLLRIFAISSLFAPFFSIYSTIKRVQRDLKGLIAMSSILSFSLITLSYSFMLLYGMNGIGYSWLLSYALCSIFIAAMAKKNRWI
ncbi:MAG: hypothetical protein RMH75_07165 [Archaeoglobaceae archaeon]|nr:hypothetical protein [Archaeoglobaceae archaeon]